MGSSRSGCVAVDAKYKLYDQRKLASGDVYQGFLYAYAFGDPGGKTLPVALILYPSPTRSTQMVRLAVRNSEQLTGAEINALGFSIPEALAEIQHGVCGPVIEAIREAIQQAMVGRHVAA